MQPQYIERIGAVVGIGDAHGAADRLGLGIERRTDRVIGTVLPIIRAGHPVRRSIAVDRLAKIERCEGLARVVILRHDGRRSEEHTSELQSLMRISYAVFCLKKKKNKGKIKTHVNVMKQHQPQMISE